MVFLPIASLVVAGMSLSALAQGDDQTPILYDIIHNTTVITGTWATGSKAVQTGSVCLLVF